MGGVDDCAAIGDVVALELNVAVLSGSEIFHGGQASQGLT